MQIVLDPRLPPRLLAEVRGQDRTRVQVSGDKRNIRDNGDEGYWYRIRLYIEGTLSGRTCPHFLSKYMPFTGQKAEQPTSTECLWVNTCN